VTAWPITSLTGWPRVAYPDGLGMRISHETIYLSLYVQHRRALCGDLRLSAQWSGDALSARQAPAPGPGQLLDTVSIRQRPAEADGRKVPGHWEGDLVLGERPSAVLTLIEPASRAALLVALLRAGGLSRSARP
jgi:IS30 family transposase